MTCSLSVGDGVFDVRRSHFKFKTRLRDKALENKSFRVHDVNESYTSKTCSCCGVLNDVGSRKVLDCSGCRVRIDRDVNAARNILIKHVC